MIKKKPSHLVIPFADRLRPDTREALDRLKAMGLEASIVSGDHIQSVAQVAVGNVEQGRLGCGAKHS